MPKSTLREENDYALPEDQLLPAELVSVSERETRFTWQPHHKPVQEGREKVGTEGVIEKWEWRFKITDGEYAGLNVWGETENFLSTKSENRVRQWGEALRGRVFEVGEGIDTDDLIGLPCAVIVRHEKPYEKRDGSGTVYPCKVDSVLPSDSMADLPPF